MAKSVIELSQEKQVVLKTLYYLGVENILVREGDGAILITRSSRGALNGTILGRLNPSTNIIDENYYFPELLQLKNHSCLVLSDLITEYCPDF